MSEKSELSELSEKSELSELGKSIHVYITEKIIDTSKQMLFLIETAELPAHMNLSIIGTRNIKAVLTKEPKISSKGNHMVANSIDDTDDAKAKIKVYSDSGGGGSIFWITMLLTDPLSVCQEEVILKPHSQYLLTVEAIGSSTTVGDALVRFKWVEKDI